MENKNDILELFVEDNNVIININGENVIILNKMNNKVETQKIFEKMNICEHYNFLLKIGSEPDDKELSMLFTYSKKFLEKLQKEIEKIDYSVLVEE